MLSISSAHDPVAESSVFRHCAIPEHEESTVSHSHGVSLKKSDRAIFWFLLFLGAVVYQLRSYLSDHIATKAQSRVMTSLGRCDSWPRTHYE